MKSQLEQLLQTALQKLAGGTLVPELPDAASIEVERTRDARHGDFATNLAMRLAQASRQDPKELAQAIIEALPSNSLIERAEVAGAGFINFFLLKDVSAREIRRIHEEGERYGRSNAGSGRRIVVELASENPVVPLSVVQGRYLAYSAALGHVLEAAGFRVSGECNVGDDGDERHTLSVKADPATPGDAPLSREIPMSPIVTLYRGGEPVKKNKRDGELMTLQQLRDEIGDDAFRFFFLMRSPEQNLDVDLELAGKRANENPLFYVQYAHARVASVMKEVVARGFTFDKAAGLEKLGLLERPTELSLIAVLVRYRETVEHAAANYTPHSIVYYLRDLAHAVHACHQSEKWMADDADVRNARLTLVQAAGQVIRNGLALLDVTAPESM